MRILAAAVALSAVSAASAQAAEPAVISKPRDAITDVFFYGGYGEIAWNWRDGGREGSSVIAGDGKERTGPPGIVDVFEQMGTKYSATAYSHDGTLRVIGDKERVTIAKHRRGVSDEHFADGQGRAFAWVERHRRLYLSIARPRPRTSFPLDFSRPKLMATGRIKAIDTEYGGQPAVVWQDGRNRIRIRTSYGKASGFGPAVTIASPGRRADALRVFGNSNSISRYWSVHWSTADGVFASRKADPKPYAPKQRFTKPERLSSEPANGLEIGPRGEQAFGQPNGIGFGTTCPNGIRKNLGPISGRPHLDDFTNSLQVAYTLDGSVWFDNEKLGPGHDARVIQRDVVWIDGNRVLKATPDTALIDAGEGAPDPCTGEVEAR